MLQNLSVKTNPQNTYNLFLKMHVSHYRAIALQQMSNQKKNKNYSAYEIVI